MPALLSTPYPGAPHNEDHAVLGDFWAVLCDGLAGHPDGQLASRAITGQAVPFRVGQALSAAHQAREALIHAPIHPDSRATLLCAAWNQMEIDLAWAGDSRAILWRTSSPLPVMLSEDHDVLHEQVMGGRIPAAYARAARLAVWAASTRGESYRMGGSAATRLWSKKHLMCADARTGPISQDRFPWKPDERLILCSDGLSDQLTQGEMGAVLHACAHLDDQQTARALLEAAVASGRKPDDVTVIVVTNSALPVGSESG